MFLDCDRCEQSEPERRRVQMGCGWLPREDRPADEHPRAAWPFGPERSETCDTCPGYTTQLPDVIDIARRVFPHWQKGQAAIRFAGNDLPPAVVDGIEVLSASVERFSAWRTEQASKGNK